MKCHAVHSAQIADSQARPAVMPCHDEDISSRTIRGYWKLGAMGCRGSVMEQLGEEPHGAPRRAKERIVLQDNHHPLMPFSGMGFTKDCLSFVIPL